MKKILIIFMEKMREFCAKRDRVHRLFRVVKNGDDGKEFVIGFVLFWIQRNDQLFLAFSASHSLLHLHSTNNFKSVISLWVISSFYRSIYNMRERLFLLLFFYVFLIFSALWAFYTRFFLWSRGYHRET